MSDFVFYYFQSCFFDLAITVCFQNPPEWTEVLNHFRGSELQNYFTKILEDNLKAVMKPQYVDQIPKAAKGTVQSMLDKKDDLGVQEEICKQLGSLDGITRV